MYRLKYKIWLDQDGKVFGQGPYKLLEGVKATGSLSQAAKGINMSYSQAHTMMKKLSQKLGFPLLVSKSGGSGGGETKITTAAQELLALYGDFYRDCESAIDEVFYNYFLRNKEHLMNDTLANAFDIGDQGIISLVGGGGKTTLMFALAKELASKHKKVLITTTTHIFSPEELVDHFLLTDNLETALDTMNKKLKPGQIMAVGSGFDGPKMMGIDTSWVDKLAVGADYIIIEADGSKQKPLKAPARHEPVLPICSTTVISVVGIDALGKTLVDDNCHRSNLVSQVSGTALGDAITVETIANTVLSYQGGRKNLPPNAHWLVCINKVDDLALQQDTAMVAKYILAKAPFIRIVATSKNAENMVVGRWQN